MRRIIVFAIALLTAALSVNANGYETPKNEVALGVGVASHAYIGVAFGYAFADLVGDDSDDSGSGAYGITYLHNFNKHIALGATGVYEYMSSKNDEGMKTSDNFITVMPTARAYWFRTKMFGMYTRLAAGVSLEMHEDLKEGSTTETENISQAHFAFHVSPVSFEVGSNKFSGFLELGYGYQGIIHAGIKFGL